MCCKIAGKRLAKKKNKEYLDTLREYNKKGEGTAERGILANKLKQIVFSVNKENAFKAQISDRINFEQCSAPFFSSIKARRKALFIGKVPDGNGRMLDTRKDIERYLVGRYEKLYEEKVTDYMHWGL